MSTTFEGRRRALLANYTLSANGLERLVVPGTDPTRNPPELELPALGLPATLDARILLLRFVSGSLVPTITTQQVSIAGAAVRWLVSGSSLALLSAIDPALGPAELAWFATLQTAFIAQRAPLDRWLVVCTQAPLPATVSVVLRAGAASDQPPAGFEAKLSALAVERSGAFLSTTRSAWLNGISHLIVADQRPAISERLRQRVVFVCFLNGFGVSDLRARNFAITGGVRVPELRVRWAVGLLAAGSVSDPELTATERRRLSEFSNERLGKGDAERWLALCTEERGDFSPYQLQVLGDPLFDVLLSSATLHVKVDCPSPFDCRTESDCSAELPKAPILDYLTRDFAGFRRLMLDRLAVLGASDPDPSPADLWSTLVELVAARADQLSYAEDAVATEAYLHTARLRPSIRRHARLLDYRMHEGNNSRAFVHLEAAPAVDLADPVVAGDVFLTRLLGARPILPPAALEGELAPETQVFQAVLPLRRLTEAHNQITIYAWGEEELCLPRGTTRCTLLDRAASLNFRKGDLVVFEATASATTSHTADADPTRRKVVRLRSEPQSRMDPLFEERVLDVEWMEEDALPFDLWVLQRGTALAVARGNLLLVDHGKPVREHGDEAVRLAEWGTGARPYARLAHRGLTFAAEMPVWDDTSRDDWERTTWSATSALEQAPESALPQITLTDEDGSRFEPQLDLLGSDRSAAEFWVETYSDGLASLEFRDPTTGRVPSGTRLDVRYRVGNGALGNVGAEAIAHLLSQRFAPEAVLSVRNPLPATGGREPETIEQVRRSAPYAFRKQQRAVTLEDWAEVASRHDEVQRAVATLRWTGSWHVVRVHVDRVEGRTVDDAFAAELTAFCNRFRLAGYDLEVVGPEYVPLEVALHVCVEANAWPEAIAGTLRDMFGTGVLSDGSRAFFHPDNFTFGDSVHLSQIVARVMSVRGVKWVDTRATTATNAFRRWWNPAQNELDSGTLRMGPLEIARCESNPSAPERGRIRFDVEGGA